MAVKPEIRYRGNHQKHPPNPKVLEVVGKTLVAIGSRLQNHKSVSAVVEYNDDANQYHITFAFEGKVFVIIKYISGWECGDVQEYGSCEHIMYTFQPSCLMEKAIIPFLRNLLKPEARRITDLCLKLNA